VKVVHVTLRFDAPGGVETNVREVTRRLKAGGTDVEVYASDLYDEGRWERRTGYRDIVDGVPVRRFPVEKRLIPGLTMPMMVGLIDALAESGADVIHAHSHRYGHILQSAGSPTVWTFPSWCRPIITRPIDASRPSNADSSVSRTSASA